MLIVFIKPHKQQHHLLLYNTIHSRDDCVTLQEDLNTLQLWANKWQMMFNPDKCKLIRITNA